MLADQFQQSYFKELVDFLKARKSAGARIYPPGSQIFSAFDLCPPENVKAVILGQDPYHGEGEAHGLCFSVPDGKRIPPSLRNIFKELEADMGFEPPASGNLTAWAKQGVFLLNAILSVEHKAPAAHKDKGWEKFTDAVIEIISKHSEHTVFILWGAFARSKASLIDHGKHLILEAPHPAAEVYAGGKAGFFGSRPFSQANAFLESHGRDAIKWQL